MKLVFLVFKGHVSSTSMITSINEEELFGALCMFIDEYEFIESDVPYFVVEMEDFFTGRLGFCNAYCFIEPANDDFRIKKMTIPIVK